MNGLINLYKPPMMSSAAAVSRVKRILGEKRVGHMGTLDPMAEGVLVIGVGKSARLFDILINKKKTYIAKFKFGYETDTLDALGTVVRTTGDIPSVDAVQNAIQSLVGETEQLPPAYSAKHVSGKRAYELARAGQSVELKPVKVTVYSAELICQPKMDEMVFSVTCSAGTYIRSICRDVAKMTGSLATLTFLQRTACGAFGINDSITLEALEIRKGTAIVPPDAVLDLPHFNVPDTQRDALVSGRPISCAVDGQMLVYSRGELFGIGTAKGGSVKITTYLRDE